jgi:hypothetical protein
MRELPVGKWGRVTLVDDDVYVWASAVRWSEHRRGYVVRQLRVDGRRAHVQLHRLITDAPPGVEVDHINGDPLDNQRANLRLVTHQQNMENKRPNARSRTGVRGVSPSLRNKARPYRAEVRRQGRMVCRGFFATLAEATTAVKEARRHFMTHAPESP